MKHDTSGLDLGDLARHLGRAYAVPIASLAFVPKGEDAFGYVAATASGERFFVWAKPAERGADPEPIYEAVADHGATPSERPHTPAAAAAGAVRLRDGLAAILSTLHGQSTTDDLQVNDRDMLS